MTAHPDQLHADKAYDHHRCPVECRKRAIKRRIDRQGRDSRKGMRGRRWVVERTLAWLSRFRRLTIRYERRPDIREAFMILGCALICLHQIRRFSYVLLVAAGLSSAIISAAARSASAAIVFDGLRPIGRGKIAPSDT